MSGSSASPVSPQEEWLWGWDPTPGIVSVWAERTGRAVIWRRAPGGGILTREEARFRPWLLLSTLDDLAHLGTRLLPEGAADREAPGCVVWRELTGEGYLRYLVSASDGTILDTALLTGASARLGRRVTRLAELGSDAALRLAPEEQYLVATGRTHFRGLAFDDLHRLQFDLETTGLHPTKDRIFLVALHDNRGFSAILDVAERGLKGAAAEADLIRRLIALIRQRDPDVIENHNLHGFDLPFLARRADLLGVPLALGRLGGGMRRRPASRGYGGDGAWRGDAAAPNPDSSQPGERAAERGRYTVPGRELIDTLDAVRRYDFAARDLPGHGLKAVARHFGLASPTREYLVGAHVYQTWLADPQRVRRYALDDVNEADGVARLLGGAAFALAQMAPRRYERLADAGPATGVLDPLLVRAYLRTGAALPARSVSDGVTPSGAALYLFATGVARQVVKADVASLYPSLMRQYRIGPASDRLGVLLALVDRLVEQRLAAKRRAQAAPPGSPDRHTEEALSAAMKILVNSAYGYLGAPGLTRFADVHAANEITRRGRQTLDVLCRELATRGATLLEADTDGVYFAVPGGWTEADERRMVAEVAALLPPLVRLEFEGRFAAMLSHEAKNYALLGWDGALTLRGVAFHSRRSEPFGEVFLREAIVALLAGDIPGVRRAYLVMTDALQRRTLATSLVASRVRLSKTAARYLATRSVRREAVYEALLASGHTTWDVGEQVRVYRARRGQPRLLLIPNEEEDEAAAGNVMTGDPRDYDATYYLRLLRETFAARLACAFTSEDFATLFDDPLQPTLFTSPMEEIHSILTRTMTPPGENEEDGEGAEREGQG